MNNRGFSLIEIMVVVIIIGILSSIAWPRYIRVVEKGRTAEAKNVLGMIRSAETAYQLEYDNYSNNLALLGLPALPTASSGCNANYYYYYVVQGGGAGFDAVAMRCASGGKPPDWPSIYWLTLNQSGEMSGDPDYL